jgi:hypothetical protein
MIQDSMDGASVRAELFQRGQSGPDQADAFISPLVAWFLRPFRTARFI